MSPLSVSRPFFSQKSRFFSQISRFFSQTHFEKIPVAGFFSNSSSKELERSRTFYVVFASMVPKNYDYRRLEASITWSDTTSCKIFLKNHAFFLKLCVSGGILRIQHGRYRNFLKIMNFSQNNESHLGDESSGPRCSRSLRRAFPTSG